MFTYAINRQDMDRYLNLHSLSEYADIPIPTLRDHIRGMGLPCYKVKGKILVKQSEFDTWIEGFKLNYEGSLGDMVDEVIERFKSDKESEGQKA